MKYFFTALAILTTSAIAQSGFSEPPAILYGKVIHVSNGASYQVFDGGLEVTLTNPDDAEDSITLSTILTPTGDSDSFSYRLEVPQSFLPSSDQTSLAVGSAPSIYRFTAIEIDGLPAEPLDSSQALLTTSFSSRAQEHRLDLKVSLPQPDSDDDGIPDWWEELHGLNPLFAGDSTGDEDADGINALDEFHGGTDPNTSNTTPLLLASQVSIPEGGSAGLILQIVDSDTAAADISLSIPNVPVGISFRDPGGVLSPPVNFTYADALAGLIVADAEVGAIDASLELLITDTTGANTPVSNKLGIAISSPANQGGPEPAIWLEPSALSSAVDEWLDRSSSGRDGYQPTIADQPIGSATGVAFDGASEFLYLDDRLLDLSGFSAFFSFNSDTLTTADQVLFNSGGLDLRIVGSDDARHASTLLARRDGQLIEGPALSFGSNIQATITGNMSESLLAVSGESLYASATTSETLPASFSTIGASQTILEGAASQFLDGSLNEVLLYDTPLDASQRSRVEDYQLSRWSGLVVWDARNTTAPQNVAGHSGVRNALNGGWGDDNLDGAALSDVLRGGPGRDRLTGNGGGDRFQIFPGHGDDTVTDFSEAEGDILDLTPIFAGLSGSPDNYLSFRTEVVRPPVGVPTINSVLEIDYDGGHDEVDQSVIFEGAALSNSDLPRLVGSGSIQLGGPMYPTAVAITASTTELTETVTPRHITLTRSGNLAASLDLDLSFVGSATADEDYLLTGVTGSGALRTVSFAPGISELTVGLTPIQDTFDELETIQVALLPSPQVTEAPDEALTLTLADAPIISIEALTPYAQRLGQVPGLIRLSRSGPLGEPLNVDLQFDGSAQNGRDYTQLSPSLTFPTGVATVELEIVPAEISPLRDRPLIAQISVLADPTRFALHAPWSASVVFVDAIGAKAQTFAQWREIHFPGNVDPDLSTQNADGDPLNNLGEYVYGTDPHAINTGPEISIDQFNSGGFIEIHVITAAGLSDASIALQASTNLSVWLPVGDDFTLSYHWLSDGRIKRSYRSRLSANNLNHSVYYRASVALISESQPGTSTAAALGSENLPLVAVAGSTWVAASDGSQLDAPTLEGDETSSFATFIDGAFTADFEWQADAGHRLVATLDGVEVASATGTGDWTAVNISTTDTGVHELVWSIDRTASEPDGAEPESLRNLNITQP